MQMEEEKEIRDVLLAVNERQRPKDKKVGTDGRDTIL